MMFLDEYNAKRDFTKTREPGGKAAKTVGAKLNYVIQYHKSRTPHYDLRLEWGGVLLSWAVPKGLSNDPNDKRLAVHVEDHPLEYRKFHGTIPAGEYGAGTVEIYDKGFWTPLNDVSEALNSQKGVLKFVIYGEKFDGAWALIRTNFGGKQDNWIVKKELNNISHPEKVVFQNENITKGDVANYYSAVAGRMLPYLKGRNIALVVCPNGTCKECFYQKNKKQIGEMLDPIKTEKDIVSHVQNNCLEFHTWGSRAPNPEKPDVMVFDLDPDEGLGLREVRQGALDLKTILDELGLKSFLKTSGNKGYHIYVPIAPTVGFDAVSNFAKNVAAAMEQKFPNKYTSNVRKINRRGKIFVDWIRNGRGATCVAPYSIRTKTGRVSMPILWSEIDKIAPNQITTDIALNTKSDPWKDFFETGKAQRIK
jgi:DNA ligase D-like protein (predicted polymerase)/DNA ligase D-like protein (predicted 3'-phosphoesterase)